MSESEAGPWPADHAQAARLVGPYLRGDLEPIGEGDFCLAFRQGSRVVRVAKHREAAGALRREACVLARIADHLPLPVPRSAFAEPAPGCAFSVHDEVRGSVLTREAWEALSAPARESTAGELAHLLAALHEIPTSIVAHCGLSTLDRAGLASSLRTEIGILHPSLPTDTIGRLEEMLDRWSAADERPRALLHRDLSPGHVLYDPAGERLTGVIDFGDVALGDAARDFIFVYEDFGPEMLAATLRHYPREYPAALLPRIHTWFLLETVEWTLARLRAGDLPAVEEGAAIIAEEVDFFTSGGGWLRQEAWDFTRFVELYNALARERGGWSFEHDRSEADLQDRYLRWPEYYPDVQTFAEGLFIWDQRLNL